MHTLKKQDSDKVSLLKCPGAELRNSMRHIELFQIETHVNTEDDLQVDETCNSRFEQHRKDCSIVVSHSRLAKLENTFSRCYP